MTTIPIRRPCRVIRRVFLAACLCCLLPSFAFAEFESAGNVVSTVVSGSAAEFTLSSGGIARVELIDEAIARIRINPGGNLSGRTSPALAATSFSAPTNAVVDTGAIVWLSSQSLSIAVLKHPFRVIALHADGSLMSADLEPGVLWDRGTGAIVNRKYTPPDEAIMGLGMRGGPSNRRGQSIVMRNTDNFVLDETSSPLYQSYPFYYGILNGKPYGLFFDSPEFPAFDVARSEPGVLSFSAVSGELNYYLIAGEEPQDIAREYGRLTGFNPLPPKWALGYHHSRFGWSTDTEIREIASQLRARNFPTDTLWFDILYMDGLHKFTWNPLGFPAPLQLHADLLADGFRSIYIDEPLVRTDDPLWSFLDAADYFVKDSVGDSYTNTIWFGNVSWIDYTKPETFDWYKNQLKTFLNTGIAGLWNDLNEPADNFMPDAVFDFDGDRRTEIEARNLYALFVNRLAWEAQRELRPNTRPWNFSRSGYSGIQRYATTWGGDGASTWTSLKTAIQISISMSISGQNHFGHDTGGFLGSPDAELFTRWLEFSLFTPLFRNHAIDTSEPREPWVYGEPHTSRIRNLIRWRYRLLPYLYTLFEEASRTGRPILMPQFFYAKDDPLSYAQDDSFLLGPSLLAAPVHEPGLLSRDVYLPQGAQWINIYTDEVIDGGQTVNVPSPLGQPVLFVRRGSIIPYGAVPRYIGEPGFDPSMTIDFYPSGGVDQFVLYEDDGESYNYQGGDYLRTRFSAEQTPSGIDVSVMRLDGNFVVPPRTLLLQLHLQLSRPSFVLVQGDAFVEYPSKVALDGVASGWFHDAATATLYLKLAERAQDFAISILP